MVNINQTIWSGKIITLKTKSFDFLNMIQSFCPALYFKILSLVYYVIAAVFSKLKEHFNELIKIC